MAVRVRIFSQLYFLIDYFWYTGKLLHFTCESFCFFATILTFFLGPLSSASTSSTSLSTSVEGKYTAFSLLVWECFCCFTVKFWVFPFVCSLGHFVWHSQSHFLTPAGWMWRETLVCVKKQKVATGTFTQHLWGDDDGDGGLIVRSGEMWMDLGLGGVYSKWARINLRF